MAGERRGSRIDVDAEAFKQAVAREAGQLIIDSEAMLWAFALGVVKRAQELCPVDYGILRASISAVPGRDGRGFYIDVGVVLAPLTVPQGHGMPEDYAVYVEFGTSRISPQPYLRPAFAEQIVAMRMKRAGVTDVTLGQSMLQRGIPLLKPGGRSAGRARDRLGRYRDLTRRIAKTRRHQLSGRRGHSTRYAPIVRG